MSDCQSGFLSFPLSLAFQQQWLASVVYLSIFPSHFSNIFVVGISGDDKIRVFTRHESIVKGVETAIRQNLPMQDIEHEEISGVALVIFLVVVVVFSKESC